MPSQHSKHKSVAAGSVGDRLLLLLKTQGPLPASELGKMLGTTTENARQQLSKLKHEGLVEARSEPSGVGRPSYIWQLTSAAQQRFPDRHAELTVQLIRTVRDTFGDQALDTLIQAREKESRDIYWHELHRIDSLKERVARLAEIRCQEGYMAEWVEDADGSLRLIENHCPIHAAANLCPGFCRAELSAFREALGPNLNIERTEHMLAGARRCTYRITTVRTQTTGVQNGC